MPTQRVKDYLRENNIPFEYFSHTRTFTTQGTAAVARLSPAKLAKAVIMKVDGRLAMAVVPGSRHVNLHRLRRALQAREVRLAQEQEFADRYPDCEIGAIPPFGNLYDMPVYVDEAVAEQKEIVFNAGTHTDLIEIEYADYVRLVKPTVADFAGGGLAEFAA